MGRTSMFSRKMVVSPSEKAYSSIQKRSGASAACYIYAHTLQFSRPVVD